jgi:SpoVK/Ycf46/Vps4 family AAA+-type ATPase
MKRKIYLIIFIVSIFFSSFIESSNLLKSIKDKYNNFFYKNSNNDYIKYKLSEMSETIPHKLYQVIEELKNETNLQSNLFLNRLILHGPPGNGKSTYAKKIAQEIGSLFFEVSAPSIVTTYQGSGSENINNIFNDAIKDQLETNKKVIIFIDEIDAIASTKIKRSIDSKSATQALWLNLDKIKKNPNIFVIMATNHFKDLNPTLLDRFGDNIIEIPNPDKNMRKEILY